MGDVDSEFEKIVDNEALLTSMRILDTQVERTREWATQVRAEGGEPTMHALMHKIIDERPPWPVVIAALSAALWRDSGEHD